jgi:ligand-binding SRPBCC domain-containing protein
MTTFETSIFINRPPQDVWDFYTNPANISQWSSNTEHEEWTSEGLPGVGSTLRSEGKLFGRKWESTSEITAWDPPNEYGQKSTSGPFPWESTIKLEPKENGTQLNAHVSGEVGGWIKMAEGLLMKQLEKQIDSNFEALKQVLEAG